MTANNTYKFDKATIEVLERINASDSFTKGMKSVVDSEFTGIFENQLTNALAIAESLLNRNETTALVASMQSGKTDTAFTLANYILPELGLLKKNETVLFVTSMTDTTLYNQNKVSLEKEYYNFNEKGFCPSNIRVEKMKDFNKIGAHIIKNFNVKYIIRDEDQYGCGQESSFDLIYFQELKKIFKKLPLIAISATPFDILDSKVKSNEVELIHGERPDSYFGITEMLKEGNIYDLPRRYKPIRVSFMENKKKVFVHEIITNSIEYLLRQDDGYGIVRVGNTKEGDILRKELLKHSKDKYNVIMIGSRDECDYDIEEGLKYLHNEVTRKKNKVVLIIIQALTAGKNLGKLKEYFRFGIEPRKSQLANGAQGIPGRICGYHENKNFILYANKTLLTHYSEFENDPEIYADEDWRYFLMSLGKIRSVSTHTNLERTHNEGFHSKIADIKTFGVDDIYSSEIENELDFLDEKSITKLRNYFSKEYYESNSKQYSLSTNCSIRLASSYSDPHRLYREWDNEIGENFTKTFFRGAKRVKYGILISNYPQTHEKNEINFCGIKVFTSGNYYFQRHVTSTVNRSMYVEPEND